MKKKTKTIKILKFTGIKCAKLQWFQKFTSNYHFPSICEVTCLLKISQISRNNKPVIFGCFVKQLCLLTHVTLMFHIYPLETSESLWISCVYRGFSNGMPSNSCCTRPNVFISFDRLNKISTSLAFLSVACEWWRQSK